MNTKSFLHLSLKEGGCFIQIDGDILLDKHFIADHLELAEKGYFVCGSRVLLGRMATARLLRGVETHPALFKQDLSFLLNAFRSHTLRLYLANRYAKNSMLRIRGCNMAFWKEDLLRVNGYNESLEMWGPRKICWKMFPSPYPCRYSKETIEDG